MHLAETNSIKRQSEMDKTVERALFNANDKMTNCNVTLLFCECIAAFSGRKKLTETNLNRCF